ncbi:MAG: hypothetical protein LBV30_08330 [Propionibacteriaceae bacterium]|nr:hypothetical protein [Propionibacteriaceae bacterium]
MDTDDAAWVVDTGPFAHLARAEWLGVLKMLAPGGKVIVPDAVQRELRTGAEKYRSLGDVLKQDWISIRVLNSDAELESFARYARRLVGDDGRNIGECEVLALAEVHGFTPLIDDGAACKAAKQKGIEPLRTLRLLCNAVTQNLLTVDTVSAVADDLLATNYRIPVEPGGFRRWASENGLLVHPASV